MAEDSAARFRASLDKLLYYDKDSGTAPRASIASGGLDAADTPSGHRESSPGCAVVDRRHEARPSDRRDYLRRVATFRPAVWFAKPEPMRPVDCARRGWTCVGPDTLECESCKARLLFAVPPTASSGDASALARRTAPKLDENHEPSCGWRGTSCLASVARFPRVPDDTLRAEFSQRRDALFALEHLPEVCSIVSAEDDAKRDSATNRDAFRAREAFASAAVAERVARAVSSATDLSDEYLVSTKFAPREASPARLRAATALALCGWTVGTREASSETRVDAAGAPAGRDAAVWSPSPRRAARRASALGKVTGSILRCALCDAKAATWNFADARGGTLPLNPTPGGAASFRKRKPTASAAALMGAVGSAFGPSVFAAAASPGFRGGGGAGAPGPKAGFGSFGSETTASPMISLGLSIAGGGTPSRARAGAGDGVKDGAAPPPAFGAGAAVDAPFGAPGVRSPAPGEGAKRKRDDSPFGRTHPGPRSPSAAGALGGPAATPAARAPTSQTPEASGSARDADPPGAFHPLRRHRAHCPWSAPFLSSEAATPGVAAQPGWQCVLDAVAPFERAAGPAGDAPAADAPGETGANGAATSDRRTKPPGRLEEYSGLSGRNAVASYLAGDA